MYQLIDGKKLANETIEAVARQIIDENLLPQLAVILVGNDPASHLYVKLKERACERVGIIIHKYIIDESADEEKILTTLNFLNRDPDIDAILIQLPLPKKYNQQNIMSALDYRKDVDGFHQKNIERYLAGKKQHMLPGLALAIWNLIAATGPDAYSGKRALIIGKSREFTMVTQKLLTDQGIPTEVSQPDDEHLISKSKNADILISAIGQPKSITRDMVKEGAMVIDIGINKVNGKTVGDVDFEHVAPQCSHITPVPGGVGPMTVAMLLFNTVILARERRTRTKL